MAADIAEVDQRLAGLGPEATDADEALRAGAGREDEEEGASRPSKRVMLNSGVGVAARPSSTGQTESCSDEQTGNVSSSAALRYHLHLTLCWHMSFISCIIFPGWMGLASLYFLSYLASYLSKSRLC